MSKNPVKSPTSSNDAHPQSLMGLHCMSNFAPLEANRNKNANNFLTNVNWKPLLNTKTGKEDVLESVFASDFLSFRAYI